MSSSTTVVRLVRADDPLPFPPTHPSQSEKSVTVWTNLRPRYRRCGSEFHSLKGSIGMDWWLSTAWLVWRDNGWKWIRSHPLGPCVSRLGTRRSVRDQPSCRRRKSAPRFASLTWALSCMSHWGLKIGSGGCRVRALARDATRWVLSLSAFFSALPV